MISDVGRAPDCAACALLPFGACDYHARCADGRTPWHEPNPIPPHYRGAAPYPSDKAQAKES